MIQKDQPSNFPPDVIVALSSRVDGTMLDRSINIHDDSVMNNRIAFCRQSGLDYDNVVYQAIVYGDTQTYDSIVTVGHKQTTAFKADINADALFTKTPGVGLFLPVADCVATVVYDPTNKYLAMVHLGRDSTVAQLMQKTIEMFISEGSNPTDLVIWMSPSAKQQTYVMQWFDHESDSLWQEFIQKTEQGLHLDLPGFNKASAIRTGVLAENIHISPINTMVSDDYFSHSMGDVRGRFAVVASMVI